MDQLRWLAQAGTGATAYVLKAAEEGGKNYAVKVRKQGIASTSVMQEDVCRALEGKILKKVYNHRNIVKLHKTGFDPLSDGCVDLLSEAERPQFVKKLRSGARMPIDCLIMTTIIKPCSRPTTPLVAQDGLMSADLVVA